MTLRAAGRATLSVLVVCLVAALVALGVVWRAEHHETRLREAGEGAVAAARSAAVALTTYDYRTLDRDHARVRSAGTAHFRRQFASISRSTSKAVRALKVTAKGVVIAAAPSVQDEAHVRVLLFVDQRVAGQRVPGTRTEEPRISMAMVRQDGRWLVDSVALENSSG